MAEIEAEEFLLDPQQLRHASFVNPELHPYAMMVQLGYLTLSQPVASDTKVHLTWPNREIRMAFAFLVARSLLKQRQNYSPEFIEQAFATLEHIAPEIRGARFNV